MYPTETSLDVRVAPWRLDLSYPGGNSSSIFTLVVSAFADGSMLRGWQDLKGLNVKVSGNVNMTNHMSYAGQMGGSSKPLRDCKFFTSLGAYHLSTHIPFFLSGLGTLG